MLLHTHQHAFLGFKRLAYTCVLGLSVFTTCSVAVCVCVCVYLCVSVCELCVYLCVCVCMCVWVCVFLGKLLKDAIMADVIDYDEFLTGGRNEATYTMFKGHLALSLAVCMSNKCRSVHHAYVYTYMFMYVCF